MKRTLLAALLALPAAHASAEIIYPPPTRVGLGAAASGVNGDITNLTALAGMTANVTVTSAPGGSPNYTGSVSIIRNANYTGGTNGWHSQALYAQTNVGLGVISSEWAGMFRLVNSNTGQSGASSQNVALVANGENSNAAGYTWGSNIIARSEAGQTDTGHLMGLEIDNQNDTADTNAVRGILDLVVQPLTAATATPEVANGIQLRAGAGGATPGRAQTGINLALDMNVGIDFSSATFSSGGPAIRLATGHRQVWDAGNGALRDTRYSATDGAFEYRYNAVPQFLVLDNGSGANAIAVTAGTTGSSAKISVGGSGADANAGIVLAGKGTGQAKLGTSGSSGSPVVFQGAQVDGSYSSSTPTAGSTVTVAANVGRLSLTPAAAIAGLTIALPTAPVDGAILEVDCSSAITNITLTPGSGYTVSGTSSGLVCGPNGGSLQLWEHSNVWNVTRLYNAPSLLVNRSSMPAGLIGFVGGAFQATQILGSASLYVGAANLTTAQCVATPANCSFVGGSNADMRYFDSIALANLYSLNGGIGVVGASRASDSTGNSPIGLAAFALSDDTVNHRGTWGVYSTQIRTSGAGGAVNEFTIGNEGGLVANNSYNVAPTGVTGVLWIGSGGEAAQSGVTTYPTSCAICVISENGIMTHNAGLVFANNALNGDDGATAGQTATAIQMAKGHEVDWIYDFTATRGFYIRSDASAAGMGLVATQTDLKLLSSAAATLADFTSGGSLTLAGFVTGSRALVTPAGTNLASATALTTQVALLNSAAAGSGVTLPNAAVGTSVWITNGTGNTQNIYPTTSSATINGGSAGAAISLANGASAIFTLVSSGSWFSH